MLARYAQFLRLFHTVEHLSCLLLGHTHGFVLAQITGVMMTQFRRSSADSQVTLIVVIDYFFMFPLNEHLLQV